MQRYKNGFFGGENYLKAFKRIVNIINQFCLIALKKNVTLEFFQFTSLAKILNRKIILKNTLF